MQPTDYNTSNFDAQNLIFSSSASTDKLTINPPFEKGATFKAKISATFDRIKPISTSSDQILYEG